MMRVLTGGRWCARTMIGNYPPADPIVFIINTFICKLVVASAVHNLYTDDFTDITRRSIIFDTPFDSLQ